jgi:NTE family protein
MHEHLNTQKDTSTMLHADHAPKRSEPALHVDAEAAYTGAKTAEVTRNTGSKTRKSGRLLSLALQGGGSFGAFTWGFLDRLLEEDVAIDVVSGASAGALNAVLLADGLAAGGNAGARERLARFWHGSPISRRICLSCRAPHWVPLPCLTSRTGSPRPTSSTRSA